MLWCEERSQGHGSWVLAAWLLAPMGCPKQGCVQAGLRAAAHDGAISITFAGPRICQAPSSRKCSWLSSRR